MSKIKMTIIFLVNYAKIVNQVQILILWKKIFLVDKVLIIKIKIIYWLEMVIKTNLKIEKLLK